MTQGKRVYEGESVLQAKRMKLQAEAEVRSEADKSELQAEAEVRGGEVEEVVIDETEDDSEEDSEDEDSEDSESGDETETENEGDEREGETIETSDEDESQVNEVVSGIVSRVGSKVYRKYRRLFNDVEEPGINPVFTKTSNRFFTYTSYAVFPNIEEMIAYMDEMLVVEDGILVLFEFDLCEKRGLKIDALAVKRFHKADLCEALFDGYDDVRNIKVFSLYYPEKKVKSLQQLASMKMGNGQQFWDLEIGESAKMGIWKGEHLCFPKEHAHILECEKVAVEGLTLHNKSDRYPLQFDKCFAIRD